LKAKLNSGRKGPLSGKNISMNFEASRLACVTKTGS
jgi:hypothetical protein